MSFAEIVPEIRALTRGEKFQLAQLLLEDLAGEEAPPVFETGRVYPIYTPDYAPAAVAQLAMVLAEKSPRQ